MITNVELNIGNIFHVYRFETVEKNFMTID